MNALHTALAALALAGSFQALEAPPPMTTVILVRHAEAAANAGADPDLTEQGRARVEALVEALRHAGITVVLTTPYRRTKQTGEPLAKAANTPLATTAIGPGAAGIDAHVRDVVGMIHEKHVGGTIVIVGHSNTVPALVKALSGVDPGEIAHDSFDRLFVVTTTAPGIGRLVRARYGPR